MEYLQSCLLLINFYIKEEYIWLPQIQVFRTNIPADRPLYGPLYYMTPDFVVNLQEFRGSDQEMQFSIRTISS
jgi:hypothetical protein